MKRARERVRAFDAAHPLPWDLTLAILVALACVSASAGLRPVGAPALLVACGAVAFRRRAPFPALAVAVVVLVAAVVVSAVVAEPAPWGYLAVWVLLFHAGLRERRRLVPAVLLAVPASLIAFVAAAPIGRAEVAERWAAFSPVAAMCAASLLAGAQLAAARAAADRRRDEAMRDAVSAERSRISREMHDLIGHDLSVIASLSAGGEIAVRSSPDDAERAFAAIGEVSRASVGQLRHVLRLLREPDGASEGARAPQPDLSQWETLIATVRRTGLQVEEERHGDLSVLSPAYQLAVYRIVQEALTNTLRHGGAGTAVTVRVEVDEHSVIVSVADRGAVPGAEPAHVPSAGRGIIGMRERVDALGGTLDAGPTAAGWHVRATIPREGRES